MRLGICAKLKVKRIRGKRGDGGVWDSMFGRNALEAYGPGPLPQTAMHPPREGERHDGSFEEGGIWIQM